MRCAIGGQHPNALNLAPGHQPQNTNPESSIQLQTKAPVPFLSLQNFPPHEAEKEVENPARGMVTVTQIISCLLRKEEVEEVVAWARLGLLCPLPCSKGRPRGRIPRPRKKLSGEIKQVNSATAHPWASHYCHRSPFYASGKWAKQYLPQGLL